MSTEKSKIKELENSIKKERRLHRDTVKTLKMTVKLISKKTNGLELELKKLNILLKGLDSALSSELTNKNK